MLAAASAALPQHLRERIRFVEVCGEGHLAAGYLDCGDGAVVVGLKACCVDRSNAPQVARWAVGLHDGGEVAAFLACREVRASACRQAG